ncbi:hypothetical protein CDL15_Pgr008388 [Punica granatum]|uniref:UspA domain-containing protein n=1 Tax=Punica granatum TaxID=22663 RepID=A0A218WMJ4_PUNGR|nr:hypothetical protein CDL15_Pgr008388 [Punica granatum]
MESSSNGISTMAEKPVIVVAVDESSHSFYALEWTLDRFFVPFAPVQHYSLVIVHARPSASTILGIAGNSVADVTRVVDAELSRIADWVVEKGKELCSRESVISFHFHDSSYMHESCFCCRDRSLQLRINRPKKEIRSVNNVMVDVMEGDARSVICEAADKHHATILVVGSHGYGPMKRAVLGSVSDFCAHHAHCSVLIVKKPKPKH